MATQSIKALLIPALMFIAEIVAASFALGWLVGALVGFTLCWLIGSSLAARRQILRRWSWAREWLWFLDPTEGFTSKTELANKSVSGRIVRIALLANEGLIAGRTFDDCEIHGPAVRVPSSYVAANDCIYTTTPQRLQWTLQYKAGETLADEMPEGAVLVRKCTFNRCRFVRIGWVGTRESLEQLKREIRVSGPGD